MCFIKAPDLGFPHDYDHRDDWNDGGGFDLRVNGGDGGGLTNGGDGGGLTNGGDGDVSVHANDHGDGVHASFKEGLIKSCLHRINLRIE